MKTPLGAVTLTTKDWAAIYRALCFPLDPNGTLTPDSDHLPMRRVLRKIGVHGMAAAVRGVAPGRRTLR